MDCKYNHMPCRYSAAFPPMGSAPMIRKIRTQIFYGLIVASAALIALGTAKRFETRREPPLVSIYSRSELWPT